MERNNKSISVLCWEKKVDTKAVRSYQNVVRQKTKGRLLPTLSLRPN